MGFNNCLHLCVEETERQSDHKTVAEGGNSKYFEEKKQNMDKDKNMNLKNLRKEPTEESKRHLQ